MMQVRRREKSGGRGRMVSLVTDELFVAGPALAAQCNGIRCPESPGLILSQNKKQTLHGAL